MNTTTRRALAAVAALGLVGAACSSDDDTSTATTAAAAPAATTSAAPATTAAPAATEGAAPDTTAGGTEAAAGSDAPAGEVVVAIAETDLGPVLVDGEGLTLYGFVPDAQGPSTCEDDCLAAWPALVGTATAGDGVDAALLGTATRADDGSEQVTYDGWPLYYFAQDAAPGDVSGQGIGDVWYVMDAAGEFVEGAGGAPTTTS